MTIETKNWIRGFISRQSPRVLVALSTLSLLAWFFWKDKISEIPFVCAVVIVAVSFQLFNFLIVRMKKQ